MVMLSHLRGLLVLWGVIFFCSSAMAFYSGEELLRNCKESVGSDRNAFCSGFLVASLQSIQHLENLMDDGENRCRPNTIDTVDMMRTFVKWGESHPEQMKGPAIVVLRLALIQSYPAVIPCNMR
jgi:hypothetical protein